ncbi:transcription factor bHLH30 [Canna indica]|uniref:Transcription factor bHLH30 n=1 Tax=Canna indica TaxID=4628 RepID=A0AAQ3QH61_9LILI|nr:transcription factor bHLH30 [Canna indica]
METLVRITRRGAGQVSILGVQVEGEARNLRRPRFRFWFCPPNRPPVGDARVFAGFCGGLGLAFGTGSVSSSSLVLDSERRELVEVPSRFKKKKGGGMPDAKTAMALKSHCEAERRRRERINMHLDKLRCMVPCTEKLDKAALLAEVISHVKKLKTNAVEISKCHSIPLDTDEVKVEVEDVTNDGNFLVKASLCCDDRPELIADLRHTLRNLKLKTVRAEISTLGGRIKNVLVMTSEGNPNTVEMHPYMTSIHQALKSLLERVNAQADFLPSASFSSKRRRMLLLESSSSSS